MATGRRSGKVFLSGRVLYHALFSRHARPLPFLQRGPSGVRRERSWRRPARPAATVALVWLAACGSNPGTPTPSPSPSPSGVQLGGPVTGRYVIQITPSATCTMSRPTLSFPMAAADAGASPHPGVQVLLDPNGRWFEWEALSLVSTFTLRGGLGTTEVGVLADENQRLWLHTIASGQVQRASDGRGQIGSGTLSGYLALGSFNGQEGELGTCTATDHAFTLRIR
jgi:hypothetical protein